MTDAEFIAALEQAIQSLDRAKKALKGSRKAGTKRRLAALDHARECLLEAGRPTYDRMNASV